MDIQSSESDVLFAYVSAEPQLRSELVSLREKISEEGNRHVVIDLSHVEIMTSPSIGCLMLLQKKLLENGRRLVLCGARLATKCTLRVAGLESLFQFVPDNHSALRILHESEKSETRSSSAGR